MFTSTLDASGEVSDGGYDLHDLIDLGDSTDDDLGFTQLPPPAALAVQDAVVTKFGPQLEVEEDESEYEDEDMGEMEEEEKEEEIKGKEREECEEEEEGVEETQVDVQQVAAVEIDSEEEKEESAEEEEESEKFQVIVKETPSPPIVLVVQNKGGDEKKHTARCSVSRGRWHGRGRGGTGAGGGVRVGRPSPTVDASIILDKDKEPIHPAPNTNKLRTCSATPSARGRGRPRGNISTKSPCSSTASIDIATDEEITPPTSPATYLNPISSGGTKPVIMTEDHYDMNGVKTPPLTPTPTPTKKMVQRKRKVAENSPIPASGEVLSVGAVGEEGTPVQKKRFYKSKEVPEISCPQKQERSTVAVQADIPASPSRRKSKVVRKVSSKAKFQLYSILPSEGLDYSQTASAAFSSRLIGLAR
ncbi:uncharacterized protein UTRI_05226 [Ustilago trichophora]|uniref:Uncharacterized protein n=1 Tax=Ustilago trichophora TaxID=86804 RepID=A0A5C3EN16_9BASI|nr:uncharacterized protein UTRI_05226 [Ustilago trichophora]